MNPLRVAHNLCKYHEMAARCLIRCRIVRAFSCGVAHTLVRIFVRVSLVERPSRRPVGSCAEPTYLPERRTGRQKERGKSSIFRPVGAISRLTSLGVIACAYRSQGWEYDFLVQVWAVHELHPSAGLVCGGGHSFWRTLRDICAAPPVRGSEDQFDACMSWIAGKRP